MRPNIGSSSLLLSLVTVSLFAPVTAQGQTKDDPAALAEGLFREGKRLMATGDFAHACPLLAESQRIDPGGGAILTLALCHESEGRTASAWAEFEEALSVAIRDKEKERESIAKAHGKALEPLLARLVVHVDPVVAATPGLHVTIDGASLPTAAWNLSTPIDPGEHRVEASAPGKRTWSVATHALASRDQGVTVPPLAEDEPPIANPPRALSLPPTHPQRPYAFAVGAASLVTLGVSGVLSLGAIHNSSSATSLCPQSPCANRDGVAFDDQARHDANLATATFVVGLVALAASAYLFLSDSSSTPAPSVARGSNAILGTF